MLERLGEKDEIQAKLEALEDILNDWENYPLKVSSITLFNWVLNTMIVPMFLNGLSSWERAFFEGDMDGDLLDVPNIEKDAERTFELLKGYDKAEMVLSRIKDFETCQRMSAALKNDERGTFCSLLRECEERQIIETYTATYIKAMTTIREIYQYQVNNDEQCDNLMDLMETIKAYTPFDIHAYMESYSTDFDPNKTMLIEDFTEKYSDVISYHLETIYADMVPCCNDTEILNIKRIVRGRDLKYDDYFRWAFAVIADKEEIFVKNCDITQYNDLLIDHFRQRTYPTAPIKVTPDRQDSSNNDSEIKLNVVRKQIPPKRVVRGISPVVEANLERLLGYLTENGYLSNDRQTICTFASRLTGKSYMNDVEIGKIEWAGQLKHLVFLLKNSSSQKVEWDKVLQFFKADGMAEHSAKLSNLTKNVGPNDSFRREMMKFGIIEEKKYEKRQR